MQYYNNEMICIYAISYNLVTYNIITKILQIFNHIKQYTANIKNTFSKIRYN